MALPKRGRTVLVGIFIVLGLFITSCDIPVDGPVDDIVIKRGQLIPRESEAPVEASFRDLAPEIAEQIDVERLVAWRQLIGFTGTVFVTTPEGETLPEGTTLPESITYEEAEFEARICSVEFTVREVNGEGVRICEGDEVEIEITSDNEAPIVFTKGEDPEGRTVYEFTPPEPNENENENIDIRELTTIRIEGEDVIALFEILTTGEIENSIEFRVNLDYEFEGNSSISIPDAARFVFEFVTDTGVFEIEDADNSSNLDGASLKTQNVETGDTLGLGGGTTTLGTRPAGITGLVAQQEEDIR